MADTKISGLTALAAADVETDADVLAIVDDSATATKKITVDNFRTAIGPKLDTLQATTSGTTKDFTIPAWAKKVTVTINGVSHDGTEELLLQLGDSGGVETSGYYSICCRVTTSSGATATESTAGIIIDSAGAAAAAMSGVITLALVDASSNTWIASGTMNNGAAAGHYVSGKRALDSALTTVRLTTTGTPDDFDAGSVNVIVE